MVMVPVVVMPTGFMLHAALFLVAMLALGFKLKGRVRDPVLGKLLAHTVLYLVRIARGNNVHCRVMCPTVHTPYVHVMDVNYTVNR